MSEYLTKSIGNNIAQVQDCLIAEESMARLILRAQIYDKGVRGRLIRQRRLSKDDKWIDDSPIDIRSLEKGESFNVELRTSSVDKLYGIITELKCHITTNGVEYGVNKYKTVKSDAILVDSGNIKKIIEQIISGNHSAEVLKAFADSKGIDLQAFADAEQVRGLRKAKDILIARLADEHGYPESNGDNSWQKYILNNNWMFGAKYLDPIDRAKINISGSIPDFIYPTADGFADMLEIKLPSDGVILQDKSHVNSWKWSPGTNAAIGQITNYIIDIERLRLEIEREIKIKTSRDVLLLKPRAFILTGNSGEWTTEKKEALRKLNSILHGIEVITYHDLVLRAERIIAS